MVSNGAWLSGPMTWMLCNADECRERIPARRPLVPDREGLEGQGRPGGMAVTPSWGGGGLTLLQRSAQGGKPGDRPGDRDGFLEGSSAWEGERILARSPAPISKSFLKAVISLTL